MSASADISKLLAGLGEAQRRAEAAALQAVDQFGEHVIGDSQQMCPVKTGALKASGTTEPAVMEGGRITKQIGHNVSYGAAVHERLDLHHDQGQAKFLETAVRNNAPKMAPFVGERVKRVL